MSMEREVLIRSAKHIVNHHDTEALKELRLSTLDSSKVEQQCA